MPFRETAAAAALLLMMASPAASQSAEETALVIATGVEAGQTSRNQAGEPLQRYEKISDKPFALKGVRLQSSTGLSDTETRVEQSGPCRYTIVTTWRQDQQNQHHDYRGEKSLDLTEAGPAAFVRPPPGANPKGPPATVDYPGAKLSAKVLIDGELKNTPTTPVYYSTQERLNAAVAHMRKTYCPGSAK